MKKIMAVVIRFAVVLVFCILTGCATQAVTDQPSEPLKLALRSDEPLLPADDVTAAAVEDQDNNDNDDAELLEEDWALMDSEEDEEFYSVADPLEPYNRVIFTFNDRLYFWVLKPVARGYRAVTPRIVRSGVLNFFRNLGAPIRLINSILQGKGQAAEAEFAKFLYNSTVGVLGFGNPAKKHPELNTDEEDLGQTLAVYNIGDGFYIVWPFLGSSTLRDSIGTAGDWFMDPVFWVEPLEASVALSGYRRLNEISFRIGDYEALKRAALDPYEAVRNAYIQLRQSRIRK